MQNNYQEHLKDKLKEALQAVLPIMGLVLVLCFSVAPISPSILLCFLMGGTMVIIGMMFFTLGAELSMTPMGERVGSAMTKSRKVWLIVILAFILGLIITISEPDLQVLASQVPSVPNMALIVAVAVGVGLFLAVALIRMLLGIPLNVLLIGCYIFTFALAFLIPDNFLAVAFDSGGVTTGPMTVPFLMAVGVGVSSIRNDRRAAEDSFGLVALCSVGPILAVMILSLIFNPDSAAYSALVLPDITNSVELWKLFRNGLPTYIHEIAVSLFPIILVFALFQIFMLKMSRKNLTKIVVGLIYTYVGLVLFLTGANVGFMPAGDYLGQVLAGSGNPWIIVPIGMIMGYFIVRAEPAVYVLNKQVENMTDGGISAGTMGAALSIGVAVSVGLAMIRVITGISILWFLIPGYAFALAISFFVPKLYTAIAFDSGGVASGPMTATFLLPFAQGACLALGGNLVKDAFGVVAMVAMTPLITIQLLGVISQYKLAKKRIDSGLAEAIAAFDLLDDDAIIEL